MSLQIVTCQTCESPGVVILLVQGDINSHNDSILAEAVCDARRHADHLVVDLTHVDYMSSAGWRALLDQRGCDASHPIVVTGMKCSVLDVYELLGLMHTLPAHKTTVDAIESFRREACPEATGVRNSKGGDQ